MPLHAIEIHERMNVEGSSLPTLDNYDGAFSMGVDPQRNWNAGWEFSDEVPTDTEEDI